MVRAQVAMNKLVFDEDVLPRMVRSGPLVDEFTEILRLGAKDGTEMGLPIVFDDGSTLWVADGTKRLTGQERIGITRPWVDQKKGTRGDAVWYASGANREHGTRLTNKEKRQAVENLVSDKSIADTFTDGALASQVGVSRTVVARVKAKAERATEARSSEASEASGVKTTKDGRTYDTTKRRSRTAGQGRTAKTVTKAKEKAEAAGTDPKAAAQKAEIELLLNGLQSWIDKVIKANCLSDDEREVFRMTIDEMRAPFRDALDRLRQEPDEAPFT